MEVLPVILAGGLGKRLWPISRSNRPKQFLNLIGKYSLFQNTLRRLENLGFQEALVVCDQDNKFLAEEQACTLDLDCIFINEPEGRNTAPALTLASLNLRKTDKNLFVIPSDHFMDTNSSFVNSLESAISCSENNKIALFGIETTEPSTAYGYIKRGKKTLEAYQVESFHEKPNKDLAKKYFSSKTNISHFHGTNVFYASC